MRRGHRRPARAAGARQALVALIEGTAAQALDAFRARHDPLAGELPPHVTLVFPFESTLSALQVATHARRIVARWPAIPMSLSGVGAYQAEWVHLRVVRGREPVVELHDRLYRRALASFLRTDLRYEPHVTIGRAVDAAACEAMLAEAARTFTRPLETTLRALHHVSIGVDGRASLGAAIPLGLA